jgi:hypothetical protein
LIGNGVQADDVQPGQLRRDLRVVDRVHSLELPGELVPGEHKRVR